MYLLHVESQYTQCETPGQLPTPRHVAEMDLGEMMISLAYVER
jgi:hypothetical protein